MGGCGLVCLFVEELESIISICVSGLSSHEVSPGFSLRDITELKRSSTAGVEGMGVVAKRSEQTMLFISLSTLNNPFVRHPVCWI